MIWVCSESITGYIYDFEVYMDKAIVVSMFLHTEWWMQMVNDLLETGRVVYVDNVYTFPQLI